MIQPIAERQSGHRSWMGALPIVSRPHFSPFKLYIRRDLELAVFLNPKVGTTTFRQILVEGLQAAGAAPGLSRLWPLRDSRRYLSAPPADYLDLLLHPQRYQFHCFVRNPYARLLSAWKNKFVLDENGASAIRSMRSELPVVRHFAERRELAGADAGSPVPFATFVAYVESLREGRRNQHWDTQRSVLATDLINYDHVYQMETEFADGMTQILTRVGLSEAWVAERLQKPRNASRKLHEPAYDADLASRVYQIYREDFEQFGYDRSSWQGL
jgi:hypothetical protein